MKITLALLVSIAADVALAQVAAYGQCGGIGYTGTTACVSGYHCVYGNAYYSQCVPGTSTGSGSGSGSTATTTTAAAAAAVTTFCGQYASITTSNSYNIINNLWGESAATSGSECTFYNGIVGNGVSWGTTWTWAGGQYNVKSYPHASLLFTPKKVSAISTMQSTFTWSYSGNPGVSDVSYDIFTASTANNAASGGDYEVMIWLAYYGGAGPISATGSAVATVSIAGHTWNLYYGLNGSMKVYSFLSTTNPLNSFSGDVKLFFTYLTNNWGYPASSQYLNTFQGGTEPFTGGPATLQVSQYSAAVV